MVLRSENNESVDHDTAMRKEGDGAWKQSNAEEPPIVSKQLGHDSGKVNHVTDFSQWLDDTLGSASYGAPRVFDLYTLLAVTLAFALLFAFLRLIEQLLLESLPLVAISIGVFVTLTAIAQLALWGGQKPRLASLVAGPVIWIMLFVGLAMQDPRRLLSVGSLAGCLCSAVLGIFFGYLGGAMVAGVFLLADVFRKQFLRESDTDIQSSDDAIWDPDD